MAPPCRFLFLLFSRRDRNASTPAISTNSSFLSGLPASSSDSTLDVAKSVSEIACRVSHAK